MAPLHPRCTRNLPFTLQASMIPGMRKVGMSVAAVAVALALGVGSAAATPADVLADYLDNGELNSTHTVADLRAALADIPAAADEESFRRAVERQIDERLLGFESAAPAKESTPPAPVPRSAPSGGEEPVLSLTPEALQRANEVAPRADDVAGLSAIRELPQPPQVTSGGNVPLAFVVLSGAAGLLVLVGAGSAAYRRLDRSRAQTTAPGD